MRLFPEKYRGTLLGLIFSVLVAAGIGLSLLLFYFYIYLPTITNHGETITVPNVEGMNVTELDEFLVERNLQYEVTDSTFSRDYPPLTILKQYPQPGSKVKENRKIFISLNRVDPPTVPVPDLIGKSLINADAVLPSNELIRGKIELVRGPFLQVVNKMKYQGKEIKPGTRIPKGSVIDLVVEDGGTDRFPMPNVLDYTIDDSKVTLFGSNLSLGRVHIMGDTSGREPVVILKQKPYPTDMVRAGDIVEVWIGKRGTELPDDEGIRQ